MLVSGRVNNTEFCFVPSPKVGSWTCAMGTPLCDMGTWSPAFFFVGRKWKLEVEIFG